MIIELQRAHLPQEIGREETCGVCGEAFIVEVVFATAVTDDRTEIGLVCPGCIAVMGQYRPATFPTIEEYEAALRRFSKAGPIWASTEEATAAWVDGEAHDAALEESRIDRRSTPAGDQAVLTALHRADAFTTASTLLEELPDTRFDHFDREYINDVLDAASVEATKECERYKEAFGLPAL